MPKQSKLDTKRCGRCNWQAPSNCQKDCVNCGHSFKVACKPSLQGKSMKRCHKCNTMAPSNRSLSCLSCGQVFVNPKAPARLLAAKPVHVRSMMVRAIIRYKTSTSREIAALKAEVVRLRKIIALKEEVERLKTITLINKK